jgi:site-specific DNA-methyltransferase (adenine-specific)
MTRLCVRCRQPVLRQSTGRRRRYCSSACRQSAYRKRHKTASTPHKWVLQYSAKTVEWATPADFFAKVDAEFGPFTLDPCATPENAKCASYYTREQDGLSLPWFGRVFCNPPYAGAVRAWLQKACDSVESGHAELVVMLLFARTDSKWFQDYQSIAQVRFLPGRLRFGDGKSPAPMGSMLMIFRNAK